jgi:hypothetical protein
MHDGVEEVAHDYHRFSFSPELAGIAPRHDSATGSPVRSHHLPSSSIPATTNLSHRIGRVGTAVNKVQTTLRGELHHRYAYLH